MFFKVADPVDNFGMCCRGAFKLGGEDVDWCNCEDIINSLVGEAVLGL